MKFMVIEMKDLEKMRMDRWKEISGEYFSCSLLASPFNRRITVYKFKLIREEGAREMICALDEKAKAQGLEKIWIKSKTNWALAFIDCGMRLEASIPGYFRGEEPALVLARYLDTRRKVPSNGEGGVQAVKLALTCKKNTGKRPLPAGVSLKWGRAEHCRAIAGLYGRVFSTYPFPVFDPTYLENTMENNFYYITAWCGGEIVAAASAEVNHLEKNAEVTDFATLPEWRGNGLASTLLEKLECRLISDGIRCIYTIARSSSTGMNKVFAGAGYGFRGALPNNCNIAGGFEDMNVWSKLV